MLLVYFRPQEVMPELFGNIPLVKFATIITILIYGISKLGAGERLITWPLEMKMVAVMWGLGLLFMPVAVSPQDSFNVLFDPFIKTVIIFVMLINLVDTRERLRLLLHILVFCDLAYALSAIMTFLEGGYSEMESFHHRIVGWGTMYANPNDLASVLNLMLPFAVVFALMRRGLARLFYFACAIISAVGVLVTFSRSGFIGLVVTTMILMWKLSRGHRVTVLLAIVVVSAVLATALPGRYRVRLSTIINPETDATNSAQERQALMKVAADLAMKRPIIGIGVGNFHVYSIRERAAHNSFLETAAELGLLGFIAYLILIFAPIRSLRRIERETRKDGVRPDRELYITSICLQASFAAYIVYGFFGSVQYLNFLYFGVAYVVMFRQIHAAEKLAEAKANDRTGTPELPTRTGLAKGTLWRPHRVRQLWLTDGR